MSAFFRTKTRNMLIYTYILYLIYRIYNIISLFE